MKKGIFLSFHSKETFLKAYRHLKSSPWKCETFTPYAVEETLANPDGFSWVKIAGLTGAIFGVSSGFFMQYYADVIQSPLNIGGRPLNSWPAFVPASWVLTILFAGIFIFTSLWWILKLPMPHHPVFNARDFKIAPGHFAILIRCSARATELPKKEWLATLHPDSTEEVLC